MGKRKKGRCVKNNKNKSEPEELIQAPHSFVIHKGIPGGHVLELTKDFRKVMEPFTATTLKENKKNSIKDFVSVAGPLHVSHLSIFSRTDLGMYLKVCRLPRGPTVTFKICNFSLARDVVSSLKKQNVVEKAFQHAPLIILNHFSGEDLHMKLMASMFQNMFPTINLTNIDLNNVRRCVLVNYNPTSKLIEFRHYTIKIIPVGISKGVKKIVQGKVPNLARCDDISEFLMKSGILSESEAEDPNNHITLSQKIISRGNIEAGQSSVKLSELGPRLTLQLIKIEDGLLDGEVLYHDFIEKSQEEKLEIQKKRETKKKLKEKRKKVQENNQEVKEKKKLELKEKSLKGMKKNQVESDVIMKKALEEANATSVSVPDDDAEYYRQEVGEQPDKDLFAASQRTSMKTPPHFIQRKRKFPGSDKNSLGQNKRFKNDTFKSREQKKGTFNNRDQEKGTFNNREQKKGTFNNRGQKKGTFNNRDQKKGTFNNRDRRPIGGKFGTKPGKFKKHKSRR